MEEADVNIQRDINVTDNPIYNCSLHIITNYDGVYYMDNNIEDFSTHKAFYIFDNKFCVVMEKSDANSFTLFLFVSPISDGGNWSVSSKTYFTGNNTYPRANSIVSTSNRCVVSVSDNSTPINRFYFFNNLTIPDNPANSGIDSIYCTDKVYYTTRPGDTTTAFDENFLAIGSFTANNTPSPRVFKSNAGVLYYAKTLSRNLVIYDFANNQKFTYPNVNFVLKPVRFNDYFAFQIDNTKLIFVKDDFSDCRIVNVPNTNFVYILGVKNNYLLAKRTDNSLFKIIYGSFEIVNL